MGNTEWSYGCPKERALFTCTCMHEQGLCDWGWCPFIYTYVYLPKSLNDTLAVDSPFETLAGHFSSNI